MNREYILAYIFIILAVIFWGFSFISTKIVVASVSPILAAFIRFFIAFLTLFIIKTSFFRNEKLLKSDIFFLALTSLMGITLYFIFENYGIKFIGASESSLIIATIPVFTFLCEVILYKKKFDFVKVICVLLSFIGVFLIIVKDINFNKHNISLAGYLLMFGAVVSWIVYGFMTKKISTKYSKLVLTYYQTLIGFLSFIPFIFMEKIYIINFNINVFFNLLYLGIICSALSYFFYIYSVDKLGVLIPTLFINLVPVISIIASYFILGEKLTLIQIIGSIIVIISVYIINIRNNEILLKENTI